jgi:peptide/nickel transport system ATP-binding protein
LSDEVRPKGELRDLRKDVLTLGEEELRALRGREMAMIFQEPMTSLARSGALARK